LDPTRLAALTSEPVPARFRHSTLEELAQNGVRRETVPRLFGGARRTLCAFEDSRKTEHGAKQI